MLRFLLLMFGTCTSALAQSYPAKPVRIIVPFPAGGGTDTMARFAAQKLTGALNRQFVVDNRAGAGGAIGAELAARAAPDGYTLLQAGVATHAVLPHLKRGLPYDALKDFDAVCLIATAPALLAVHPSLPVRSVREFVALAHARPGQIDYAFSGHGSSAHLSAELFKSLSQTKLNGVPYKGGAPGLNDVLAGQVQVIFNAAGALLPHAKGGRLRALGVGSLQRVDALPNVPPIHDAGVPGYQAGSWYGIVAPAGTPRPILNLLNREIVAAIKTPEIASRLAADASLLIASTPDAFTAHIRDEHARIGKLIRDARIAVE
jgi:tripartite-type tricarboxylate transporter receptor subunit TctC